MPAGYAPLYFASQVLNDGRVIVNGGEYNRRSAGSGRLDQPGRRLQPDHRQLGQRVAAEGWASIGDAQSVVLPNGKYMLANALTTQQALLNPSTMTWTPTGAGKFDVNDEEGWTLLQDGTVFTADGYVFTGTCGKNTERYNPATGAWTSAGEQPGAAVGLQGASMPSNEIGPQVLRADGSVVSFSGVATGAVAGTSIYRPASRTWSVGPNLPKINGENYNLADAPAAWLKNGQILFAASPGLFQEPTHFFLFTTVNGVSSITQVGDTPHSANLTAFVHQLPCAPDRPGPADRHDLEGLDLLAERHRQRRPQARGHQRSEDPHARPQLHGERQAAGRHHVRCHLRRRRAGGHQLPAGADRQQRDAPRVLRQDLGLQLAGPQAEGGVERELPGAGGRQIETGPSTLFVVANGVQSKAVAVTVN